MNELMRGYFVIGMCVLFALIMGGPIIISDWLRDRRHTKMEIRAPRLSSSWAG
jgi:hypothetical protein